MQSAGITPTIINLERNFAILKNLSILYDFGSRGALSQGTSASYIAKFEKEIEKLSNKLTNS